MWTRSGNAQKATGPLLLRGLRRCAIIGGMTATTEAAPKPKTKPSVVPKDKDVRVSVFLTSKIHVRAVAAAAKSRIPLSRYVEAAVIEALKKN